MKFENTKVFNFEGAFRGMRNPKESWDRSDSFFGLIDFKNSEADYEIAHKWTKINYPNYQLFIDEDPKANNLFYEYGLLKMVFQTLMIMNYMDMQLLSAPMI